MELRNKVISFGINIIPQIIDGKFDEKKLLELRDSELLNLCLQLNLISEEGFFKLDQCRNIRNSFSSAHPTIGKLDEYEFLNFLNRISKYALNNEQNTQAVDMKIFIQSIKENKCSNEQIVFWGDKIINTYTAQRETIFGTLHGLYCDSSVGETARLNVLNILKYLINYLNSNIISLFINKHQEYFVKSDEERKKASRILFENLKLLGHLSNAERHAIISYACQQLITAHIEFNNFYNESPYAERLQSLTQDQKIPDTVRSEFIKTVISCSIGNQYGTSVVADTYYKKMIKKFTPSECLIALELSENDSIIKQKIDANQRCKEKYKEIIKMLDQNSIPVIGKKNYLKWTT